MIHELPNNYYGLIVPEGAEMFHIADGRFDYDGTPLSEPKPDALCYSLKHWPQEIDLPSGQWQIVGLADAIGEDVKEQIVDHYDEDISDGFFKPEYSRVYRNYAKYSAWTGSVKNVLFTAIESYKSLLSSLGLNPSTTIILKRV